MSGFEDLRARARNIQGERNHDSHEEHEQEKRDGTRAAEEDLPRIRREIEKRMDATGLQAMWHRNGSGQYTYAMPPDFKSHADKLRYQKVLDNGHAFIEAYAEALRAALNGDAKSNDPFSIDAHSKHGHAHLSIGWKGRKKGGNH